MHLKLGKEVRLNPYQSIELLVEPKSTLNQPHFCTIGKATVCVMLERATGVLLSKEAS